MLKFTSIGDVTEIKFDNIHNLNMLISDSVKKELKKLFEKQYEKVLINMENITFIDSSGFAALLSVTNFAQKNSGQVIFCNVSDSAMELFQILQLHTIFTIVGDKQEALKLFK